MDVASTPPVVAALPWLSRHMQTEASPSVHPWARGEARPRREGRRLVAQARVQRPDRHGMNVSVRSVCPSIPDRREAGSPRRASGKGRPSRPAGGVRLTAGEREGRTIGTGRGSEAYRGGAGWADRRDRPGEGGSLGASGKGGPSGPAGGVRLIADERDGLTVGTGRGTGSPAGEWGRG